MFVLMIIVAALVLVISITGLLFAPQQKLKRTMDNLIDSFSRLVMEQGLNLSGQQLLRDAVMGLDGVHRKFILVRKRHQDVETMVVDLDDIKSCSIKKHYGGISRGSLKTNALDHYLERIHLRLLLHGKPPLELEFYNRNFNKLKELAPLETKARHWESLLSKMQLPQKKIV